MKNNQTANEYSAILNEMESTFLRKSGDYGTYAIEMMGLRGVVVRIWDKVVRILTLVGYDFKQKWFGAEKEPNNESLEDSFLDLASYCIIAVIVLRGKWGAHDGDA